MNALTQESDTLLATTTELIDPTKIKQIQVIIAPDGQIQNLTENIGSLKIESGQVGYEIENI